MRWKKNSILWKWTLSYILVFLVPISAIFINYGISIRALKEEVISVNELTFNNAADNIDHYLELLRENYIYAFLDDSFEELRRNGDMNATFYRKTSELQQQLHYYRNGVNDMFCMIYMQKKDYLVTSETSSASDIYYTGMKYQDKNIISYTEWIDLIGSDYSDEYIVADVINYWKRGDCLAYAKTVSGIRNEQYNIIVSIPLATIEKVTEYLNDDSYMLLHMDGEEPLVFHKGMLKESPDWLDNEDYFIRIQKDSGVKGISYELVFSEQCLMNELQGIRTTFWMNLLIIILLALIGIMVLLWINYQPIYTMINEFNEEENNNANEFEQLSRTLHSLTHEKYTARKLLKEQQRELINSRLLMLMKGRGDYQNGGDTVIDGEFTLNGKILLVGFMVSVEENDPNYDELPFFIVNNIFSELVEREHFYHIEDGSFIFYLFNFNAREEEPLRQEIIEKSEYLCSLLYDKWGLSIFGAVSEMGDEIRVVKHLYQDVLETLEYQKVAGGYGVMDVRILPDYDELHLLAEYWYQWFSQAFAEKDIEGAKIIVEQVFSTNEVSIMNATILKMRIYEMFNVVKNLFREYVSDTKAQEEEFRYLEIMMNAQTKEEMKVCFCNLLQYQIGVISRQQVKEGKALISKVVNYVEENYMDYNLCLTSIAEALDRNPRYISKTFKEETNMGILDYINGVRIEKAKELMANKMYSTQEISERVGYANVRTFRKAFEKATGKTPASWRQ